VSNQQDGAPPWERHGPLVVAADGRSLAHADGTTFFWLGDTPWSLVELPPDLADVYLADRAGRGFTVIQINATNFGRANYRGDRAFPGDGPPWESAMFEEAYWQHVDTLVERAASHGLYVMLLALWGHHAHHARPGKWRAGIDHYVGEFFQRPDTENGRFGSLLGARYADAPNIIWCVAGEYHSSYQQEPMPHTHRERLEQVARGIRAGDGGRHLMGIHPMAYRSSSDEFHDAPWLDFNMAQSHVRTDYIDHLLAGDRSRSPAKPALLAEGSYEQPGADDGWRQRYQAYWALLLGSCGYGYGHELLWRLADEHGVTGRLSPAILDSPGARAMVYLARLLVQLPPGPREPDQELIPINWRSSDAGSPLGMVPGLVCAARGADRGWALVYSTCGYGFELRLGRLACGAADAHLYNPRTGMWRVGDVEHLQRRPAWSGITCGPGSTPHFFALPGQPAPDNDWLLLVERAATTAG
jgi:hypothetical protein